MFLAYDDCLGFLVAYHAAAFTGIFQAVDHLPLLAPEPLPYHDHHQCTDSGAVRLDAFVLTTGATALHLDTMCITHANDSHFCHTYYTSIQN